MTSGRWRRCKQKEAEVILVDHCDLVLQGFRYSLNSHPGTTAFMLGFSGERWWFP